MGNFGFCCWGELPRVDGSSVDLEILTRLLYLCKDEHKQWFLTFVILTLRQALFIHPVKRWDKKEVSCMKMKLQVWQLSHFSRKGERQCLEKHDQS